MSTSLPGIRELFHEYLEPSPILQGVAPDNFNYDYDLDSSCMTWITSKPTLEYALTPTALSFWATLIILMPKATRIIERHATRRIVVTDVLRASDKRIFDDPEFVKLYPNIQITFFCHNPVTKYRIEHIVLERQAGIPVPMFEIIVFGEKHFVPKTPANIAADWAPIRFAKVVGLKPHICMVHLFCSQQTRREIFDVMERKMKSDVVIKNAKRGEMVIDGFIVIDPPGKKIDFASHTEDVRFIITMAVTRRNLRDQEITGNLVIPRGFLIACSRLDLTKP
jgi:hypothetical protein